MSKGSKSRTTNKKDFDKGYDNINWEENATILREQTKQTESGTGHSTTDGVRIFEKKDTEITETY